MMNLVKKITAISSAVLMMSTMVISAGAYSGSRMRETSKSSPSRPVYISCYRTGGFTSGYINGSAWTKTSSINNVLNPNCAYNGYISVVTACGSVHGNNNHQNSSSATCTINGATTSTTVTSNHVFESSSYGNLHFSF